MSDTKNRRRSQDLFALFDGVTGKLIKQGTIGDVLLAVARRIERGAK